MERLLLLIAAILFAVSLCLCGVLCYKFVGMSNSSFRTVRTNQTGVEQIAVKPKAVTPDSSSNQLVVNALFNSVKAPNIDNSHNAANTMVQPGGQNNTKNGVPQYAHISQSNTADSQYYTGASQNIQTSTDSQQPKYQYSNVKGALPPPQPRQMSQEITPPSDCQTCTSTGSADAAYSTEMDYAGSVSCKNPDKNTNDELYALLNPAPKAPKFTHINPIYEYGKAKETPLPETGLPLRTSTEALFTNILMYGHYPDPLPRICQPKAPEWNKQLEGNEPGTWRKYITPYWKRTDFGAAYADAPSSKWDELGILLGVAWSKGIYDIGLYAPIELNSFGGQMSSYDFYRIGLGAVAKFNLLQQCKGKWVDFSIGADIYMAGSLGKEKYVKNSFQPGGGLFMGIKRDFGFCSAQGELIYQSNGKDDESSLPSHISQVAFRLTGGVPIKKNVSINPYFYYNTALGAPEYVEEKNWMEYGVNFAFGLNPNTVFTFKLGAESSPLKTWHMGGGLDMKLKF